MDQGSADRAGTGSSVQLGAQPVRAYDGEEIFEVFARRKPDQPLHHVGYVSASSAELAGVYARSIYDEFMWIEMVVVPRAAIHHVIEV